MEGGKQDGGRDEKIVERGWQHPEVPSIKQEAPPHDTSRACCRLQYGAVRGTTAAKRHGSRAGAGVFAPPFELQHPLHHDNVASHARGDLDSRRQTRDFGRPADSTNHSTLGGAPPLM
ncbi:hypothetical protein MTO96_023808 [Rhipicephalus appendiculatus]